MKVTEVRINKYNGDKRGICGEATVVLNNELIIHKIFIVNGNKGLFVSMPNTGVTRLEKGKKKYKDIVHPISKTLSEEINSEVLNAYKSYCYKNN